MALTIDQLVNKLARIGVIEAAADGAFHDLPYGQGGGGTGPTFEYRRLTVVQDPQGAPGTGYLLFEIEGTEFPFVDVTVLQPLDGFSDQVTIDRVSPSTVAVQIRRTPNGGESTTPLSADIGVRLQYMPAA